MNNAQHKIYGLGNSKGRKAFEKQITQPLATINKYPMRPESILTKNIQHIGNDFTHSALSDNLTDNSPNLASFVSQKEDKVLGESKYRHGHVHGLTKNSSKYRNDVYSPAENNSSTVNDNNRRVTTTCHGTVGSTTVMMDI